MEIKINKEPEITYISKTETAEISINEKIVEVSHTYFDDSNTVDFDTEFNEEHLKQLTEEEQEELRDFVSDKLNWG